MMFITNPVTFPATTTFGGDPTHRSNAHSRVWSIELSNGLFIPLVAIVISLRIFTKLTMTKQVFIDDYLMIGSAALFLILSSVDLAAVSHGFGRHIEDVPGSTELEKITSIEDVLHHNFISIVMICLSICLAKLSIIATLLHIFSSKTLTTMRSVLLGTGYVVILSSAAQFFFLMLQCSSVRLSWQVSAIGTAGTCSNLETTVMVTGTINTITDFVITCAPIPIFMKLQMPMRQRLCLCALFMSGLIACFCGMIRVISARGLGDVSIALDATYTDVPYFNWSIAEAGLCIVTGSVPGLRPLLATILPHYFESLNVDSLFDTVKDTVKDTVQRVASRQGPQRKSPAPTGHAAATFSMDYFKGCASNAPTTTTTTPHSMSPLQSPTSDISADSHQSVNTWRASIATTTTTSPSTPSPPWPEPAHEPPAASSLPRPAGRRAAGARVFLGATASRAATAAASHQHHRLNTRGRAPYAELANPTTRPATRPAAAAAAAAAASALLQTVRRALQKTALLARPPLGGGGAGAAAPRLSVIGELDEGAGHGRRNAVGAGATAAAAKPLPRLPSRRVEPRSGAEADDRWWWQQRQQGRGTAGVWSAAPWRRAEGGATGEDPEAGGGVVGAEGQPTHQPTVRVLIQHGYLV